MSLMLVIPRMGGGGSERMAARLANSLADRGEEVTILTLVSEESFYQLSPRVRQINAAIKVNRRNKLTAYVDMARNFIRAALFIRKSIIFYKPETVFSLLIKMDILVFFAGAGLFFRRVCSERNDPRRRPLSVRLLLRLIYRRVDMFVCQTARVSEMYAYISPKRRMVIPNFICDDEIPPRFEGERRNVIASVGRLHPQKNYAMLIDAFSKICSDIPGLTLEIYGEGGERDKLLQKIESQGLTSRVLLMGLYKDVWEHIRDVKLFAMSSSYEGCPNALLEAMATGLPVVSTDFSTGAACELVHKANGITVPVGDTEAFARAMLEIVSSREKIDEMSNCNFHIREVYSIKKTLPLWYSALFGGAEITSGGGTRPC